MLSQSNSVRSLCNCANKVKIQIQIHKSFVWFISNRSLIGTQVINIVVSERAYVFDFSVLVFNRKIYTIEIFRWWWNIKEKLHELIRRFSYYWLTVIENKLLNWELPKLRIAKLLSWRQVPLFLLLFNWYSANTLKKMCQIWNHLPQLFSLNLSSHWKSWS